jgi:hypothetical protein
MGKSNFIAYIGNTGASERKFAGGLDSYGFSGGAEQGFAKTR